MAGAFRLTPRPRSSWLRRRPERGLVVLVIPTARIRRLVSRALLVLVVVVYFANFVLAELAIRPPLNRLTRVDVLRMFPITSWGLYADLPPDEFADARIRLELPSPWHGEDFDDYVRRYPTFPPGVFHARIGSMLARGRDYPARRLLRFLLDGYWAQRKHFPTTLRPDSVRVRVIPFEVSHGRLRRAAQPERVVVVPLPGNGG